MCHYVTLASVGSPVVPNESTEGTERSGVHVNSDSFFNRSVFDKGNSLKMTTLWNLRILLLLRGLLNQQKPLYYDSAGASPSAPRHNLSGVCIYCMEAS